MAKHRIRRWLQFGVLDLLIVMTIAAVGAVLWRPLQAKTHNAPPWVIGAWTTPKWVSHGDAFALWLLPDGCYVRRERFGQTGRVEFSLEIDSSWQRY
jgi:hypothetical protein